VKAITTLVGGHAGAGTAAIVESSGVTTIIEAVGLAIQAIVAALQPAFTAIESIVLALEPIVLAIALGIKLCVCAAANVCIEICTGGVDVTARAGLSAGADVGTGLCYVGASLTADSRSRLGSPHVGASLSTRLTSSPGLLSKR